MPRRCCVPGCKSNYHSTLQNENYVSMFIIPKYEGLKQKWIKAIPRKNWTPTKDCAVCANHFRECEIVKFEKVLSPDGVLQNTLLRFPRLIPNTVPSVFPNLPSYLTKPPVTERLDPELRRQKHFEKQCQEVDYFIKSN